MAHYLKNVAVLLSAFLATVSIVVPLYGLLALAAPGAPDVSNWVTTAAAVLVLASLLRVLAGRFLFETPSESEIQLIGGVRFGGRMAAALKGGSASWPFAKLSASSERLRLETPFGRYVWRRQDVRLSPGAFGRWSIEPEQITFYAVTQAATRARLAELGYTVKP